jgi:glycosyltransferase involved in cell wall biosynthesis
MSRTCLGYLLSQYPAINHTHLLREVNGLRALGIDPIIVSIRGPDRSAERLSAEERAEVARTWYLKTAGIGWIARAQLRTLAGSPAAYLRTLFAAVRLGSGLRGRLWHLFYFVEAIAAGQYFIRSGVTHVHTHFVSTVALLITRVFPLSFSSSIHGSEEFEVADYHIDKKVAEGRFTRAISYYGKSQILKASAPEHWHKVEICRLGVDTELYRPQPVHSGHFRVLSVGRAVEAKGHRFVIEAVADLLHSGRDVELVIAGGGPDLERLRAYAQQVGLADRATFTGFVDQASLRELYNSSHCFVLASFAEGVPTVLVEAMAMGVASISTWITGVPEVIRHGVDGLIIPPASKQAIADAVARFMDDQALWQRVASSGRERIVAEYDLRTTGQRLAEVYARYLNTEIMSD